MATKSESGEEYLEKRARMIFIAITLILFGLMIFSFSVIFDGTFSRILNESTSIPLEYYLPTLMILPPMILSLVTIILFINTLNPRFQVQNYEELNGKKTAIFRNILNELHNPTSRFTKRRKILLWTFFTFTFVTIITSRCYVIIILTIF